MKCEFFEIFVCVYIDWYVCEGDVGVILFLKIFVLDISYRVFDILGGGGGGFFLMSEICLS